MTNQENKNQILIVDDTPQNIQVLGKILDDNNYSIIIAQNGLQALKTLEKVTPDLILLDIMMPELDGFETCKRIKENPNTKDIPVIFLTAKTESYDLVKGFELGAVDYIGKPFRPAELLKRVQTHIELKDKTNSLEESNKNYRELLHVLSHDLANPIGFIYGIMQLSNDDPSIFNEMNKELWISVNNCLDIIRLVKEMRALDEGKHQLTLELFPLKECLNESLQIIQNKIKQKNIDIQININDSNNVLVERTSFVNSILNNLMTNAIKFSNYDSKIIISSSEKNEIIQLTIKDFGIGMPAEILNNIFKINVPTTRPGTDGERGTGFGMPLVKKFLESYGGKIEIKSKDKQTNPEDHGTEIILSLKSA